MTAQLSFFPVGNGDMTLVQTEGGNRILIDMNIRSAADDPDDDTPDVAAKLRDKLARDAAGRLYVNSCSSAIRTKITAKGCVGTSISSRPTNGRSWRTR